MGKVNKRLSFKKSFPQNGTPKKNKLKQLANQDISAEDKCLNNNKQPLKNSPETVTKRKSIQAINNFKNKKGKHNKYKKLLNLRVSQLLQRQNKTNVHNASNVSECLKFNAHNSINEFPSTSSNVIGGDSSKMCFSPQEKMNLKRSNTRTYAPISLDSPDPKSAVRYPVICEIDLTESPRSSDINSICKSILQANAEPSAMSTPFSYAQVAGIHSSPNTELFSPINKKLRLSVDNTVRRMNDDASKTTFIYEPPEFLTVDRYDLGQSSLEGTALNTVICVDNEESALPTENPSDDTLNLNASDIEFVSRNNSLSCELNNEKFDPAQSIDLTNDLRENTPALPVPARQIIYDLTLDNSYDVNLPCSLLKKKDQILAALAETVEDSTQKYSRRKSVTRTGSNIYFPGNDKNVERTGLRMVVIDGSNVAMGHRHGKSFSVEGLNQLIYFFLDKGHEVKAFVPRFRNRRFKSTNPRLLDQLEEKGHVVYTPSREIKGKLIVSYDDRYIVQCAVEYKGIIVSNDNFRDLLLENEAWRETIEQRVLPFTWVGDMIIFPQDPLGKNGPSLREFLRHPEPKTKSKKS